MQLDGNVRIVVVQHGFYGRPRFFTFCLNSELHILKKETFLNGLFQPLSPNSDWSRDLGVLLFTIKVWVFMDFERACEIFVWLDVKHLPMCSSLMGMLSTALGTSIPTQKKQYCGMCCICLSTVALFCRHEALLQHSETKTTMLWGRYCMSLQQESRQLDAACSVSNVDANAGLSCCISILRPGRQSCGAEAACLCFDGSPGSYMQSAPPQKQA